MERAIFKDCSELGEYMIDRAQDGHYVVAALYYDNAIKLLRELLLYEDVEAEYIDIKPIESNGYEKEYYVSITEDMIVSVEPAFVYGRYLDAHADLTLVDNEANSKIISEIDPIKCREIYIGTQPEEPFCYNDLHEEYDNSWYDLFDKATLYKDENGNIIGIAMVSKLF